MCTPVPGAGKTDKPCPERSRRIDADGLATLLHTATLPSIWIAPGSLREERELPRTVRLSSRRGPHGLLQNANRTEEPHAFHPGQGCALPGHPERHLRPQVAG